MLQHGVAVALTNYGLAPQTSIEDIVRQQLKALAWLYHNAERLRFNPDRIVVAGHSAGGHLTAMMMAALWQQFDSTLPSGLVKAGLAISGLFDLRPLVSAPFVNVDLKLDLKRARALSPIEMPSATSAPLITAVGALESSEFKRQSTEFGARWSTNLARHLELPLCKSSNGVRRAGEPGLAIVRRNARTDSPRLRAANSERAYARLRQRMHVADRRHRD